MIDRIKYPPLNLPPYAAKVRSANEQIQIYDRFRKKYLILTPEEWVRQHFSNYMVEQLEIPEKRMVLEAEIKYGRVKKRPDICVVNPDGSIEIIVECKAADVSLTQSVLDQCSTYASVLEPKFMAITNGQKHLYFQFQPENKNFVSIDEYKWKY